MNSDYQRGYRGGLVLAAKHVELGMKPLDAGGLQRYVRAVYGTKNTAAANARKAGFREGYNVGMEAAQIECSRVTTSVSADTETGGSGE